jgi:GH25 family lysozyme M1 (1,4-beta-N-acetylmuramidase)
VALYIPGIDVSSEQGVIDWAKVAAAGIKFAFAKCGSGNDGIDPHFAENVAGGKANGIVMGAYQFIYPIGLASSAQHPNRQADEQAKLHFGWANGLGCASGDLVTFMDAEWPATATDIQSYNCSPAQVQDWLGLYKQTYESESGYSIGLYTDEGWWQQMGGSSNQDFAASYFWSADPQNSTVIPADGAWPRVYSPFSSWSVWQYSWKLIVPGIIDAVDADCIPGMDVFTALTTRS